MRHHHLIVIMSLLVGLIVGISGGGLQGAEPVATPQQKKKPKNRPAPRRRNRATVGPAIGGNKATPINRITAAKGFKVELLYSVPGVDQGSWVNLCTDNKGRLLVSDQFGGMYRITPPPAGSVVNRADVEKVPADIRAVNGMVWAFGALYVGVNDYERKFPSGLYRVTDSIEYQTATATKISKKFNCFAQSIQKATTASMR